MEMSAKDKKLLVYLLAVGIIAGTYFFAAKPLLDKQAAYTEEISSLQQQVLHYGEIYSNVGDYEGKIAEAQTKYSETVNKFFGGLNQDNTIMMVKDLENTSGVWISRLSFQDETVAFGQDEEDSLEEDAEVVEVETTSIKGIRQDLNIDYAAKYDDFKRFIEYIENYDERLFITSLTASYAVDSGLVGGSIVLSQFAVIGTDKEYKAPDLTNVRVGNDTIFKTGVSLLAPSDESTEELATEQSSEETAEDTSEASGESENNQEASSNDESSEQTEDAPPPVLEEGDNGNGRRRISQ